MAFHGGPIKISPASVHFLANAEFSLNYSNFLENVRLATASPPRTYEAITWMYPSATFSLSDIDDSIPVKIGGRIAKIDSILRAQSMLSLRVRVRVDSCGPDTVLGSCPSNTPIFRLFSVECFWASLSEHTKLFRHDSQSISKSEA